MAENPSSGATGTPASNAAGPAPDIRRKLSSAELPDSENRLLNTPRLTEEQSRELRELLETVSRQRTAMKLDANPAHAGTPRPAKTDPEDDRPRSRRLDEDSERKRRDGIPAEWRDSLLTDRDRYVLRSDPKVAVFRTSDSELATKHNDPEIARLLVAAADARGWGSLAVRGTEVFRREVWIEATARGIQVNGYRGREVDAQEATLRARQFEDRNRIAADKKAIRNLDPEAIAARNPAQSNQAVAIAAANRYLDSENPDPTSKRLIDAAMRESLATRTPQETRPIDMKAPRGIVRDFGQAHYQFDPNADQSYYVTLERNGQSRTLWGKDLERAIKEANLQRGDTVTFERAGRKKVEVNTKVLDADTGQAKTARISADRQQWRPSQIERGPQGSRRANPDLERDRER